MREIIKYGGCFVCGDDNPGGLHIRFFERNGEAVGEYTPEECFQGYRGFLHGGLVSTLLDEIMAKAVLARERYAMTAEITVRFRRAIPIGLPLRLVGRIVSDHGRMIATSGEIMGVDGGVYARATGKYLEAAEKVLGRF